MSESTKLAKKESSEEDKGSVFRTIGDVSSELSIPPHVLRFWESKFLDIKPHKRKGGHRYYSPSDVNAIKEIQFLLYEKGFTIKGAKKFLKDKRQNKIVSDQQSLFGEVQYDNVDDILPGNDNLEALENSGKIDIKKIKFLISELEGLKKVLQ